MWHVVAHARPETLVFRSWQEAQLLWSALEGGPACVAAALMPDHVHVLLRRREEQRDLVRALIGYGRTRNALRGERGPAWCEGINGTPVRGAEHVRRTMRYIHLNPCRRRLAADPLAWPFSTHRDCVGLVMRPIRAPLLDAARFHAFVSADPSVDPHGTDLPVFVEDKGHGVSTDAIRSALSALLRVEPAEFSRRGPARSLLVSAARSLSSESREAIVRLCAVSAPTLRRAGPAPAGALRMIRLVLHDPRFPALHERELRKEPEWKHYRHRR